jgi:predicted secreted protein
MAAGAIVELVSPLIEKGIGIQQLPCPEKMLWGGINRLKVMNWDRKEDKDWILGFNDFCKNLAKDAVDEMEDAVVNGYSVLGVIAMDGSPTCGTTRTQDIPEAWIKLAEITNNFKDISMEKMDEASKTLGADKPGSGRFMGSIIDEIKKRELDIPVIGFDSYNDFGKEQKKIFKELEI